MPLTTGVGNAFIVTTTARGSLWQPAGDANTSRTKKVVTPGTVNWAKVGVKLVPVVKIVPGTPPLLVYHVKVPVAALDTVKVGRTLPWQMAAGLVAVGVAGGVQPTGGQEVPVTVTV